MKIQLASLLNVLFAIVPSLVHGVTVPGADTPEFYLVSSSTTAAANLLVSSVSKSSLTFLAEFTLTQPLRSDGGSGGYATLTGTSPIGVYYFIGGVLTAAPDSTSSIPQRALIGPVPGSTCSAYGALGFTSGSSSDKCVLYNPFTIQSNTQNSQLGAKLVFNATGGFYACGSGLDVSYEMNVHMFILLINDVIGLVSAFAN